MLKELLLPVAFLFLGLTTMKAQVAPPCPLPPPPGAESCQSSCVYCDFDGYTGINNGTPSGGNTVCGQIALHNDQWFGFVAGTQSISIDILTSNCLNGNGLQAAFFDDCNADAITCNPGFGGGGSIPLNLTYSNFVPGQTYYLMIDGWTGDVCNFEIDLVSGSITPPPPSQPAVPQGPTQVCPGATVEYSIPAVDGAGYYRWTAPAGASINGGSNNVLIEAPLGTTVTITFANAGGQVCVQAGNACFPPLKSCLTVTNVPIPNTIKPPLVICYDDLPFIWDEEPFPTLNNTGTFTLTSTPYNSYLGCDSIIKQNITIKNQIKTNIGLLYVCEGSCLTINDNIYCTAGGPFQETMESYQGCDSVIQFTIITIPASATIAPVQTVTCTNPDVVLSSSGSTTGPNVSYNWTNTSWGAIGNGPTTMVTAGGQYHLIVSNQAGLLVCKDTATIIVQSNIIPPGAAAQGGVITCLPNGSAVTLQGASSTGGVNYSWTGPGITPANKNLQNPSVTQPGTYVLTVTNPTNNCTSTATASVTANNTVPVAFAIGGTITCAQPVFPIDGATDAVNATFVWAGPGIDATNKNLEDPPVTVPGTYSVTITNVNNGCTNIATAAVVEDTTYPVADAGNNGTITCTQMNFPLNGNASPATVVLSWTGPGITVANENLLNPVVNQPGPYILTVTNPANGCATSDTAFVGVSLQPPSVNAGVDTTITCVVSSVALGGNGTSQGVHFQATWTGPGINPGNEHLLKPVVSLPGTYTLSMVDTTNGCTATDVVAVGINIAVPTVNAGGDRTLTCSAPGVVLNGSGQPANITFLWSGPGIGGNNATQPAPQVSQPGIYTLLVTNPVNGCTSTDQVQVLQGANVPTANAGQDLKLTCSISSVNIDASGSSSGAGILYEWTGPGITPANSSVQSPSGISLPGTYTLTVANTDNNCINTDVVVVTIDTLAPLANAGADLVLNCYNKGADTLNAGASSSGANFLLQWAGPGITFSNENNPVVLVSIPGTYDLSITNTQNNCTATDQVVVVDDQLPPTADAGSDQNIDCITTSTMLGGNSSLGAGFSYQWTGPGVTLATENLRQPTVSQAGTYTLVVANAGNGCTATDETTVTLNAVYPTTTAGPDLILTCAQPVQLLDGSLSSAGIDFQPVWTGPGIDALNQGVLSPTISLPGMYILVITNKTNSCQTTDTVLVLENKLIPAVSAGADQGLDCATTNVMLDGSESATGPSISYQWTGPGIDPGNANEQSPAISVSGTYSILVTDTENGCTASDDVVVNQDVVLPVASAGAGIVLTCAQSVLPLDGSASSTGPLFEYLWEGPGINTNNFNLQNPMVADSGTYQLTVSNLQNHCTSTAQVYVAKDGDFPLTEAGPDKTLNCLVDTLELDGAGSLSGPGIQYAWSGPGLVTGDESSVSPRIYLPGVYTLTVSNTNNGCSATDIVAVSKDVVVPIADAGTNQLLTCTNTTGVSISAAASSTGPGFTIQWTGPGINQTNKNTVEPVVTVSGTYTLVVTSVTNGCTNTDNVEVEQDQDLPVANAGPDQTLTCAVSMATLDASGSSGNAALDYTWTGPGINLGNQKEVKPAVSQPGTYTITVSNVLTGCSTTDIVEVLLDTDSPGVTVTGGTITCTNPQVTLGVISSLANSDFEWSGPDIDVVNIYLQNPPVDGPGSYTVVVTAPNGCTASAGVIVDIDADVPTGSAEGTQLDCANNGQSTISGKVITPGASSSWSGPNGFTSNLLSPAVTAPGTYTFTVVGANGCTKKYQVSVNSDYTAPVAQASVNNDLDCTTTSMALNGAGSSTGPAFTYNWTTTTGHIASGATTLQPVVDAPGQYSLLVTNHFNGCTSSTTVNVALDPDVPTAMDLTIKNIRCFGETNGFIAVDQVIGGAQPFQFSFNSGPPSSTAQFSKLSQGTYTIQLVDAHGCLLDTTVSITAPGALQVDLTDDILVHLGDRVTVAATITGVTPVASITWNPPPPCLAQDCLEYDTLPTHSYRQFITVVDSNGCVVTDQQLIRVDRTRHVYVPNAFNPASNAPSNAILMVQGGKDVREVKTWQVFDRWGNAIFSRNNFQPNDETHAWDGRFRGNEAPVAVYVWYIEVEFLDGEIEQFTGDVTLLRN